MSNRHGHRPARPYHYDESSSATSASYEGANVTPTDKHGPDSYGPNSVADSTKHKRSRSGCYTCRNRRVKCDELKPTCDRCRKGKRNCIYPEPPRPSRTSHRSKSIPEEETLPEDDDEEEDEEKEKISPTVLDSLQSDRTDATPALSLGKSVSPSEPRTPLHLHSQYQSRQHNIKDSYLDRSPRSIADSLSPPGAVKSEPPSPHGGEPTKPRPTRRLRSDLPPAHRFYLDYQRGHMSYYHYGLTLDARGFVHNYLITQSLNDDALLYAVVAFAAYHHAVRAKDPPHNTVQAFLPFYTKSLNLLRTSLEKTQKGTVAHLLTVLQLAALEEHLGDFVTLTFHQKAAYRLLTSLFKPETMLQDDIPNKILEWYIRFDLFVGFITGTGASLDKVWFKAQHQYYVRQVKEYPNDMGYKWDERNASARLLAKDVSLFFADLAKGQIDQAKIGLATSDLSRRFAVWYREVPSALTDPSKIFKDVSANSVMYQESLANSAVTAIYGDELWPTNHMMVHLWSCELMFNHRLALMQQQQTPPDVASLALYICQIFEAVEKADPTPASVLGVHAATSMCSVFLSKKPNLTMWFRKKQVAVESQGYSYPSSFRSRMSKAWNVDVDLWWLPNGEGQTDIMRQIRAFVEDRKRDNTDSLSRELASMDGIFAALKLQDDPDSNEESEEESGDESEDEGME